MKMGKIVKGLLSILLSGIMLNCVYEIIMASKRESYLKRIALKYDLVERKIIHPNITQNEIAKIKILVDGLIKEEANLGKLLDHRIVSINMIHNIITKKINEREFQKQLMSIDGMTKELTEDIIHFVNKLKVFF